MTATIPAYSFCHRRHLFVSSQYMRVTKPPRWGTPECHMTINVKLSFQTLVKTRSAYYYLHCYYFATTSTTTATIITLIPTILPPSLPPHCHPHPYNCRYHQHHHTITTITTTTTTTNTTANANAMSFLTLNFWCFLVEVLFDVSLNWSEPSLLCWTVECRMNKWSAHSWLWVCITCYEKSSLIIF